MERENNKETGILARGWQWIKGVFVEFNSNIICFFKKAKKIGEDDPRKIIHSLKVGLALTFVSLIYYFSPIYKGFGVAAMWAVLTVVVVFEYTVGATLAKGLNRAFATLLAGVLGVGAHHLASHAGEIGEPILLGIFVFLLATASTFSRFFPGIKARYDYGVLIFILTFSLVSVSSFRVEEIIELAHQRLSTIAIGGVVCILVSVFICPVWAGEDLHKLVPLNMEKLAIFLDRFPGEHFNDEEMKTNGDKSSLQAYKSVLNSKVTEESLANFARWEPCHGRFGFRHPWKQYLAIGLLNRQCAYLIEALNGCVASEVQAPRDFRQKIQVACIMMSREASAALTELASSIRTMTKPSAVGHNMVGSKAIVESLKTALSENTTILEILSDTTLISLLIEIISHVEKIAKAVDELARLANFKSKPLNKSAVKPLSDIDNPHIIITVPETVGTCEPVRSKQMDV